LKRGLVGLKEVAAKHAASHDNQICEQPRDWRADGTAAHAHAATKASSETHR
jgi:hypothetical protein